MTTDHRTSTEIERDIERERAGLTNTLDNLQDRFSIDGIVRQISDQFRENSGEIGRTVAKSVKENPLALAITGVGLAWLIFGNKSSGAHGITSAPRHADGRYTDPTPSNGHDKSAPSYGTTPSLNGASSRPSDRFASGYTRTPRYSTTPSWARDDDGRSIGDRVGDAGSAVAGAASSAGSSVANAAGTVGDKASNGASRVGSAVADAPSSAGSTVADAAKSAGESAANLGRSVSDGVSSAAGSVADAARAGRDSVASGASAFGSRIADGTEMLSQEARARVIAARQKAIAARREADRAVRKGAARASDFYEEQPLVAGLLAMAAGAAVAGALPRTQYEDEHLGEHSDSLMQEAEAIFREETEKAKKVAQKAADEAAKIARETKDDLDRGAPGNKSAVEAIADKAKADGKRIANAAKSEAEKQNMGNGKA